MNEKNPNISEKMPRDNQSIADEYPRNIREISEIYSIEMWVKLINILFVISAEMKECTEAEISLISPFPFWEMILSLCLKLEGGRV